MKTNSRILLMMILLTISSGIFAQQRPSFNKSKDILIACFDIKPDPDDIHAVAALGSMLAHPDLNGVNYFAVAGAYGSQNGSYLQSNSLFSMAFGNNWTDAHSNRSAAITAITNKVTPILKNGGKVWIQEGGQSDVTADWLMPLINANNGINSTTTKNNVIVVQHDDGFNEKQSNQTKLSNVKANTRYFLIDDGNAGPNQSWGDHGPWSTPMYRDRSSSFVDQAKNSPNSVAKKLWTEADRLFNSYFPNGFPHDWSFFFSDGVDYSDCVENWWIFEIGSQADTHGKFWNRYVMNTDSNNGGGNNGGGNASSTASYDFGTGGSPLFSGYTRITPTSGNWTNTSGLNSRDRGAGPNALNRDFIFSSNTRTFEHNVPNGTYDVTVTFGDKDYSRNGQAVKAEGVTKSSNINTNKNQFVNRSFQTTVSDGKLSLEFSTTSGVWCVNRVTIKPASGGGNNGGNQVAGSYDLGTGNSPLFSEYTRITPSSGNWTNTSGLNSRDRGTGPNALNRDFIFSANARTFEHTTGNGSYDVTVTFGDRDYSRTGQAIKAEGTTVISGFNTNKNQFRNATFQTTVNDGKLSLEFSASTGVWCVTRIVINPVRANLTANSKELKRDLIIKAYPNPTFDIVQVNADNVSSLKVRNLAGQIVLRNTKQSSIDIRNLNNGIYILEVSVDGDDRVISQKIVKN